ncbi:MAG: TetR/AcrR family transcriptional regulator [Ruminiclostridium sp.]|nr:TetR/AcrR family transcriptional regulator [Ruminiclostridium sp.]
MTRKEQKEMRQKQIMFKALELFVTKGFAETRITDIAEALDISVGLLFHYYESKEKLYLELVKMGLEGANGSEKTPFDDPLSYFGNVLDGLLSTASEQPWICMMFVLMAQAQKPGIPEEIRQLALTVDQISFSAGLIEQGQKLGSIREGDPLALSNAFWCSVQGIMEYHAAMPEMPLPKTEWILDIIRKERTI